MKIKINKNDKAKVLAALYNNSKAQGLGVLHFTSDKMQEYQAKVLLDRNYYFDYLCGRVMKVDMENEEISLRLYDRDNGKGSGALALNKENIKFEIIEN
jgi:hypothetical protein